MRFIYQSATCTWLGIQSMSRKAAFGVCVCVCVCVCLCCALCVLCCLSCLSCGVSFSWCVCVCGCVFVCLSSLPLAELTWTFLRVLRPSFLYIRLHVLAADGRRGRKTNAPGEFAGLFRFPLFRSWMLVVAIVFSHILFCYACMGQAFDHPSEGGAVYALAQPCDTGASFFGSDLTHNLSKSDTCSTCYRLMSNMFGYVVACPRCTLTCDLICKLS